MARRSLSSGRGIRRYVHPVQDRLVGVGKAECHAVQDDRDGSSGWRCQGLADLGQRLRFGEQRDDSSWSRPAFATTTTTTSSVTRSPCVAGEISEREFTAELVEVVDRQAQTHRPATLMQ
jgi:hypothetical protein